MGVPAAPPTVARVEMLTRRAELTVPVVAIGGITLDNVAAVVDHGAHGVAVISALFDAPDIEAAARSFSEQFTPST